MCIKKTVLRVESEETQDHVRETLAIGQGEAEDIGFVPSARGEPRGPVYWCDNRCSEKAIRYWQIASIIDEEGGEAHTIILCQQGYNEKLAQQGKQPLKLWQWREQWRRRRTVEGNFCAECRSSFYS